MTTAGLRRVDGGVRAAPEWSGVADAVDDRVLAHAVAPVLDIGCGPGRHVEALARRGLPVLGIDIAVPALSAARRRGVIALERSIFTRVPASGRWQTALLLDGNLGIDADPVELLRRVRSVLAPDGRALVETAPPGAETTGTRVRLEVGAMPGPWFTLAPVCADAVPGIAASAGFACLAQWCDTGRWFAHLGVR